MLGQATKGTRGVLDNPKHCHHIPQAVVAHGDGATTTTEWQYQQKVNRVLAYMSNPKTVFYLTVVPPQAW